MKGIILTANIRVGGSGLFLSNIDYLSRALRLIAKECDMKIVSESSSSTDTGVGIHFITSIDEISSIHIHTSYDDNNLRLVIDSNNEFDTRLIKALVLSIFNLDINMVTWKIENHTYPTKNIKSKTTSILI